MPQNNVLIVVITSNTYLIGKYRTTIRVTGVVLKPTQASFFYAQREAGWTRLFTLGLPAPRIHPGAVPQ